MKPKTEQQPTNQIRPEQIISLHHGYIVELCQHRDSLKTAFELRSMAHEPFTHFKEPSGKLYYDKFDNEPHSYTFLVWKNNQALGSIRSLVYSDYYNWRPTEAMGIFTEDINREIGKDVGFIESDRLIMNPKFQWRQSTSAQLALFQMHIISAQAHKVDQIITIIKKSELDLYEKFLGMDKISSDFKRVYWAKEEVCLMAIDVTKSLEITKHNLLPSFSDIELDRFKTLSGIF